MSKFHERLKELRLEKGLSQNKLAPQIGFQQATICDWEAGKKEPTTAALISCATFFDVTTDYLLGREDEFGNISITSGNVSGNNNTVNSNNVIHSNNTFSSEPLSADERELITLWKKLPPDKRKAFINLLK